MVDLDGFSRIRSKNKFVTACYIKRSNKVTKLVIDPKTAKEAVSFFGSTVTVLVDYAGGRVAVMRGNERRITSSPQFTVSLGGESMWVKEWGNFSRIYLKPKWDEDAGGRKVLMFEPDGKPEMSEEMTVRRIVDGR